MNKNLEKIQLDNYLVTDKDKILTLYREGLVKGGKNNSAANEIKPFPPYWPRKNAEGNDVILSAVDIVIKNRTTQEVKKLEDCFFEFKVRFDKNAKDAKAKLTLIKALCNDDYIVFGGIYLRGKYVTTQSKKFFIHHVFKRMIISDFFSIEDAKLIFDILPRDKNFNLPIFWPKRNADGAEISFSAVNAKVVNKVDKTEVKSNIYFNVYADNIFDLDDKETSNIIEVLNQVLSNDFIVAGIYYKGVLLGPKLSHKLKDCFERTLIRKNFTLEEGTYVENHFTKDFSAGLPIYWPQFSSNGKKAIISVVNFIVNEDFAKTTVGTCFEGKAAIDFDIFEDEPLNLENKDDLVKYNVIRDIVKNKNAKKENSGLYIKGNLLYAAINKRYTRKRLKQLEESLGLAIFENNAIKKMDSTWNINSSKEILSVIDIVNEVIDPATKMNCEIKKAKKRVLVYNGDKIVLDKPLGTPFSSADALIISTALSDLDFEYSFYYDGILYPTKMQSPDSITSLGYYDTNLEKLKKKKERLTTGRIAILKSRLKDEKQISNKKLETLKAKFESKKIDEDKYKLLTEKVIENSQLHIKNLEDTINAPVSDEVIKLTSLIEKKEEDRVILLENKKKKLDEISLNKISSFISGLSTKLGVKLNVDVKQVLKLAYIKDNIYKKYKNEPMYAVDKQSKMPMYWPQHDKHGKEVLVSVVNVDIRFKVGGRRIVKASNNINFDVYRGETFGLVGESGSGKTTISRAILGLNHVSRGGIYFHGQLISRKMSKKESMNVKSRMQMIFQDPAASLNERANVEYIVSEGLRSFKLSDNNADRINKVENMMEKVGLLPEHLSRFSHEFSGGQRQRIGIARALIVNPELVLADEPISALDVSIRAQVLNLLKKLQNEQKLTYIFVAHDLSIIRYISDRVAVMHQGYIVEVGSAYDIYENPFHPYTRSLLTAIPQPDPDTELYRKRKRYVRGDINYAKCHFMEVEKGHYVLSDDKLFNKWSK